MKQAIFSAAATQPVLPRTKSVTGILTALMERTKKIAVSTIHGSDEEKRKFGVELVDGGLGPGAASRKTR